MSTEVVESLAQAITLKPGDEIRIDGRWLEVQSARHLKNDVFVTTWDPEQNVLRNSMFYPFLKRRVRQIVEVDEEVESDQAPDAELTIEDVSFVDPEPPSSLSSSVPIRPTKRPKRGRYTRPKPRR